MGKFKDLLLTPVSLARAVADKVQGKPDTSTRTLPILTSCKGVLRPGTTTLLLAPPGHGKTSFLRALAGRLPAKALSGSITYSGVEQKTLRASGGPGVHLSLLANYVDQLDTHLPYLTVRETATFACVNSTVVPEKLGDPMLVAEAGARVERVLTLLKLQNCANTLVGNELVRGVSGGEKKRVTIAEALVTNARLLCMDEISTGLDASVTFDICASIHAWAHEMNGTVVIALLQPTPEVYGTFDDVLLMREGSVVFHGRRTDVGGYLGGLGFAAPKADDAEGADMADWLVDVLVSPTKVLRKQRGGAAADGDAEASASQLQLAASGAAEDFGSAPRTTKALVAAWAAHPLCQERSDAPATVKALALESDFARAQYGRANPRTGAQHFRALVDRQVKITARNSLFVVARIMSSLVMSTIFGSMWFNLNMSEGLQKYGMLLFALLQIAFANLAELPFAVEYKLVACKQIRAGLYPAWGYTYASTLVMIPIAAVETCVFTIILYYMVGLVNDGARWAFFYLVLGLVNVGFGSLYRGVAYIVPNYETAQTAPGPFIAMQVIFAGFLIPPKHMGTVVNGTPWLIFMYYASLFAYALRSLAHNEFYAPKYNIYPISETALANGSISVFGGVQLGPGGSASLPGIGFSTTSIPWVAVGGSNHTGVPTVSITDYGSGLSVPFFTPATCAATPGLCDTSSTLGTSLMKGLNINLQTGWKWGGVGFVAFFLILANVGSAMALSVQDPIRNVGTSRQRDEEEPEEEEEANGNGTVSAKGASARGKGAEVVEVVKAGSVQSVLPLTPMTVAWRGLKYTVQLNKNLGGGEKTLLQGVSGVAVPGKLMSLMGASGAGKSTLLDVIAGRKTGGKMEGDIFLNGFPRETKSFARLTAYCEQMDVHNTFATVREALHFSAALRLSSDVPSDTKAAFVEEMLDLLELRPTADRLIGEVGAANGLAPGQRKILTIAVELVSNAPILFLDEPTRCAPLRSRASPAAPRLRPGGGGGGGGGGGAPPPPPPPLPLRARSGLDSRAAAVVIHVVRNVTSTGRTVITTIHQPNSDIFFKFDEILLMQRGGWMAYYGPIGRRGASLISYMEALPGGVKPCPPGMNPASWMLDVLSGSDSSAGVHHAGEGEVYSREKSMVDAGVIAAAAVADAAEEEASSRAAPLDGPTLQEHLLASDNWKKMTAALDAACTPAPGATAFKFDSVYARTLPQQLLIVLRRCLTSHNRNIGYQFVKIMTLLGLNTMFGTIYYKIKTVTDCAPATGADKYNCTNDTGGVQSVVAVVFITALFASFICMSTVLPVMVRERAVFYRERFSRMYAPEIHALAYFLSEIPWLYFMVFLIFTGTYFMFGFSSIARYFFTYLFIVSLMIATFLSIGQWAAAHFPTAEIAQTTLGVILPLCFLFGGLYLPKPLIPDGPSSNPITNHPHIYWQWAYYVDPISYVLEGLVPMQFVDQSLPSNVNHMLNTPYGQVNSYLYVSKLYSANYNRRWVDAGCLGAFIFGIQFCHLRAVRTKLYLVRRPRPPRVSPAVPVLPRARADARGACRSPLRRTARVSRCSAAVTAGRHGRRDGPRVMLQHQLSAIAGSGSPAAVLRIAGRLLQKFYSSV